jgi:hypothetical protein
MKSTQINIRCQQETADSLKMLAESERLTLGAFLEKLLACYQPAIVDSSPVADDWKVGMEARLDALESQFKALSADSAPIATPKVKAAQSAVAEPVAGSFKDAAIRLYQSGITNYQQIANLLSEQGYRNGKGNLYGRREVQRVITACIASEK